MLYTYSIKIWRHISAMLILRTLWHIIPQHISALVRLDPSIAAMGPLKRPAPETAALEETDLFLKARSASFSVACW